MNATSFYDSDHVPSNGRLRVDYCWAPETKDNLNDYLQLDLGGVHFVCAVATQGNSKYKYNDWTKKYKMLLSLDNLSWNAYKENGNTRVSEVLALCI